MPRKKFNKEQADKIWKNYTSSLLESINEAESEGLKRGYSSYEIERLWQTQTREKARKSSEKENSTEEEAVPHA